MDSGIVDRRIVVAKTAAVSLLALDILLRTSIVTTTFATRRVAATVLLEPTPAAAAIDTVLVQLNALWTIQLFTWLAAVSAFVWWLSMTVRAMRPKNVAPVDCLKSLVPPWCLFLPLRIARNANARSRHPLPRQLLLLWWATYTGAMGWGGYRLFTAASHRHPSMYTLIQKELPRLAISHVLWALAGVMTLIVVAEFDGSTAPE